MKLRNMIGRLELVNQLGQLAIRNSLDRVVNSTRLGRLDGNSSSMIGGLILDNQVYCWSSIVNLIIKNQTPNYCWMDHR